MNEGKLKTNRGITMITLIITIVVMVIIAGTTVYTSLDRFEINKLKKLRTDLELLSNKVANYYLKYNGLPLLRDSDNNSIQYTYTTLDFDKNENDSGNYYIMDLAAMEGISLNYGKEGFENPNTSDDVYVINEKSHTIYYVRGIELDGITYHYIEEDGKILDTIPPSKPNINIISGTLDAENPTNEDGTKQYNSDVEIEIVPGKDNVSGVLKTEYTITRTKINTSTNTEVIETNTILEPKLISLTKGGQYEISVTTTNNSTSTSTNEMQLILSSRRYTAVEYLESTGTQYIDTGFKPNQDSGYNIKFAANCTSTDIQGVYGSRYAGVSSLLAVQKGGRIFADYKAYPNGRKSIIYTDGIHEVYVNKNTIKFDNNEMINNDYTNFSINLNNYVFANNGGFKKSEIKLYYLKIYDNEVLVRDYIPVLDDDGIACLYDKVEKKFYYNSGTGTFKTNLDG